MSEALRDRFDATLRDALQGATSCALVGFPRYGNPGDSAIWLGQLASLRRSGVAVRHVADRLTYDPAVLVAAVPDGAVLLTGGGTLGDRWPAEHELRLRVLRDLRDRPVVQLPQSVGFAERSAFDAFARLVEDHRDLTVLVRDAPSAARLGDVTAALVCPDAAFALDDAELAAERSRAERGVSWVLRTDSEASPGRGDHADAVDWHRTLDWLNRAYRPLARRSPPRLTEALARARLRRGLRLLRSDVVVTDRLHAHVLATLLGRRTVPIDTIDGKVRDLVATWAAALPPVDVVGTVDDAAALVG